METHVNDEKQVVNENTVDEDWSVPCSDEEVYSLSDSSGNKSIWQPSAAEIIQMYQTLESKGMLDLEWQCPGRRSPSVHSNESESVDKRQIDEDDNSKDLEPNEFDFDDEVPYGSSTPKITPRRRTTPASSGQKRIARLDKVMFDIRRYRKMDELELQKSVPLSTGLKNKLSSGVMPAGE